MLSNRGLQGVKVLAIASSSTEHMHFYNGVSLCFHGIQAFSKDQKTTTWGLHEQRRITTFLSLSLSLSRLAKALFGVLMSGFMEV